MTTPTQIVCLGISHHTAPVELREHFRCALNEQEPALLHAFGRHLTRIDNGRFAAVQELIVLATCNRMEIYAAVAPAANDPASLLTDFLRETHHMDTAAFTDHLYRLYGRQAVAHLCRVATGLDSLVLGESQILGQVNDAYQIAGKTYAAGPVLSALFRAAVRAGKRARTETAISNHPASVSSISIALAQALAGDLHARRILVIGLGEMGRLTLRALQARDIHQVSVANRSQQRAQEVAARWGYNHYPLTQLPEALVEADIVFSATGATTPLIDLTLAQTAVARRHARPLVIIDMAVPRDVDPAVGRLPGVRLLDMDDLQGNLDEALAARRQETPKVEAIIAEEVAALDLEWRALAVRPVIASWRQKAEAIRQRELERTLRHLGDADPELLARIHQLSQSLVNKLLHEPTLRLKEKAGRKEAGEYLATVRDLFGLEEE